MLLLLCPEDIVHHPQLLQTAIRAKKSSLALQIIRLGNDDGDDENTMTMIMMLMMVMMVSDNKQ